MAGRQVLLEGIQRFVFRGGVLLKEMFYWFDWFNWSYWFNFWVSPLKSGISHLD
jgi:hypothetical protein